MKELELQHELDIEKWLESEKKHRDLCGEYEYCAYCDNDKEYPCAYAYIKLTDIEAMKNAKKAEKPKPVKEEKEAVAAVVLDIAEEAAVAEAPRRSKEKRPVLTFSERLELADDSVKELYKQVLGIFAVSPIKGNVTKVSHNFAIKRVPVAKLRLLKKGMILHLALDPKDERYEKIPHKDASDKATYVKTPFVFKVGSGLSLRRLEMLVRDIVTGSFIPV